MNAHQRRKHIRHHRPLIQQITATLTLLDMPERAKSLQSLLPLDPLRAINEARKYERSMPEKDWVIEPFYGASKWSKSIYAKQLRREFMKMNELRDEIDKISGMQADTLIKDDVLDAFTYSTIGLRPSEEVDRPLGQDRPRVRLLRPRLRLR